MPSTPGADQLQALINLSNDTTGASDAKISDAIATLIAGYGGGGTSGEWSPSSGTKTFTAEIGTGMSYFAMIASDFPGSSGLGWHTSGAMGPMSAMRTVSSYTESNITLKTPTVTYNSGTLTIVASDNFHASLTYRWIAW